MASEKPFYCPKCRYSMKKVKGRIGYSYCKRCDMEFSTQESLLKRDVHRTRNIKFKVIESYSKLKKTASVRWIRLEIEGDIIEGEVIYRKNYSPEQFIDKPLVYHRDYVYLVFRITDIRIYPDTKFKITLLRTDLKEEKIINRGASGQKYISNVGIKASQKERIVKLLESGKKSGRTNKFVQKAVEKELERCLKGKQDVVEEKE